MAHATGFTSPAAGLPAAARLQGWPAGWVLLATLYAYLFTLRQGARGYLLVDGDTYWHIAAGRWILEHGRVPSQDPFSHTMPGAPWTAHEWLSEVVLAWAHDAGGWTLVTTVTALAFAGAIGLLMRALLHASLDPVRSLLLVALAVLMTGDHLLARPHLLAMPLLVLWMSGLIGARDAGRVPSLWLVPVMAVWANLHGGFTLGLAFAGALGLEAVLEARRSGALRATLRDWGLFLVLATGAALLTPHGGQAFWFTWEVMTQNSYALSLIGEWRSPNFQKFQPLAVWLLLAMGVALHQGLRLPPMRLVLLLGLVYLALKHARNVELVGLVGPLLVAAPLAAQWAQRREATAAAGNRVLPALGRPATALAMAAFAAVLALAPLGVAKLKAPAPPPVAAPVNAVDAALAAGARGPVFNSYSWGGYLIYRGIPAFVDGRAEMYGDKLMREYTGAADARPAGTLERVLDDYRIQWTLLPPTSPAVAVLDRLPGWRRVHSDKFSVVHLRPLPSRETP